MPAMWARVVVVTASCAAALAFAASSARADRAAAAPLEAAADAAAGSGDFATAAADYRAAFAADPRAELECNAGVAYYKLRDLPRADRYLAECVAHATELSTEFVAHVHAALAAVESALLVGDVTPVDLAVSPPTASVVVDLWPDEPIVGPHRVWLAFGHHQLAVSAPGFVARSIAVEATGREPTAVRVQLDPVPPVVAFVARPAASPPPRSTAAARALVYGAAAVAVVGIGFHLAAYDVRGKLETTSQSWDANHGAFEALRAVTIGCYAAAVIAGGIGGALWYARRDRARERAPRIGIGVAPGAAVVGVTWQR